MSKMNKQVVMGLGGGGVRRRRKEGKRGHVPPTQPSHFYITAHSTQANIETLTNVRLQCDNLLMEFILEIYYIYVYLFINPCKVIGESD